MKNKLSYKRLWNITANNASDFIQAAGWVSSFTREPFSNDEMEEYIYDCERTLTPYLSSNNIVLEIGCASGLTSVRIAPYVMKYIAIDFSEAEIRLCKKNFMLNNIKNYETFVMSAENIDELKSMNIDIIIINSVLHCFENISYLNDIINKCIGLFKQRGMIYIGDVMDPEKKDELLESVKEFKAKNPNVKAKISFDNELFVDKEYFTYLCTKKTGIESIKIIEKSNRIENELTKYRYNVLICVNRER